MRAEQNDPGAVWISPRTMSWQDGWTGGSAAHTDRLDRRVSGTHRLTGQEGFYRHARCTDPDEWHHCRQCQPGTFLEHSNYMRSCEKCDSCDESCEQGGGECDSCDESCFYRHTRCTDPDERHHCRQCRPGTFLEHSNYMRSCEKCDSCDESLLQVVVRTCSPSSRTQCGCPGGYYKSRDSLCRPCTPCQHRPVNSNCRYTEEGLGGREAVWL
ncbi:UNVERIFIED_CONTAM: hypothetical protein FKN15_043124 [Acipenser sinensis]